MCINENLNPQRESFSNRIKLLRTDAGLTQDEMGARVQLGKMSVSQYENGRRQPSLATIFRYAVYFNVSADYLLGLTDRRFPLARQPFEERRDSFDYTIFIAEDAPEPFRLRAGEALRFRRQSHAEPGNIVDMIAEGKSGIGLCLNMGGTLVFLANAAGYRVFPQTACQILAVATEIVLAGKQKRENEGSEV